MRVKLKQEIVSKYPDLTDGNVYRVLGIEANDFRILSDEGRPFLFPFESFEVVDPSEPTDWVVRVGTETERYAYPPELSRPGFFEDFFDDEPGAVAVFRSYMSGLCRPSGSRSTK